MIRLDIALLFARLIETNSPVQVKNSVSVYIDRDSDRDRDKKNIDKFINFFGTINIDRDIVRNRNATKP